MDTINGDVVLRNYDRCEGVRFIGCNIKCDFPLFCRDYKPPKLFEFRGALDDKSEDFKLVFENAELESCIINGTDA